MTPAALLITQGADQGARFEIESEVVTLGRGLQADIRVLDTEVSRVHATLQRVKDTYVLSDRNSSNGTVVNGKPIRSTPLQNGDQIQLGRTVLLFSQPMDVDSLGAAADRVDLVTPLGVANHSQIVSQIASSPQPLQVLSQDLAHRQAELQALYQIAEEVVRPSASLEQVLKRILDLTIDAVQADRGCILISEGESADLQPIVAGSRDVQELRGRIPISRSIVDFVYRTRQGVRTSDARNDQRFETGPSIIQEGICEALCVPLQGHGELLGVVYVDRRTSPDKVLVEGDHPRFIEDQLRLLMAIGRQAAIAIENHRYHEAMVKAERLAAVGQTIATLSHHIKNILQGVRGGSYLIERGLTTHEEEMIAKGWQIVDKNQGRIYHLVMDMLSYSKERQPEMKPAFLNDVAGDVVELMQSRAESSSIELVTQFDSNLPVAVFDDEAIHRAILNIVTNAMDAVEDVPGARIVIETGFHSAADTIWIAVADNGPGIPPEVMPRLFNIFESTKGARGTGLGLAVSQKIVREHGGEITVESIVGRGTRFMLAWPRQDDEDPRTVTGNDAAPEE